MPRVRGIFVTGTGTEVGKSVVSAAICAALAARGKKVAAYKPVVTGIGEESGDGWPLDHELLASVVSSGQGADDIAPIRFEPPVSPHHAAELAGTRLDPAGDRDARQRCGVRTARDLTGPVGRGRRAAAARRVVRGGRGRRMNLRTFLPPLPIPVSAPPEPGEPARELPEPGLEPGRPS